MENCNIVMERFFVEKILPEDTVVLREAKADMHI